MKQLLGIGMMVVIVLSSVGCSRLVVRNEGLKNTVVMNKLKGAKSHFLHEHINESWLWGIIPPPSPYLSSILKGHVSAGDKVSDLQLREEVKAHQVVLCIITAGIYCQHTLAVEGDIL